MFFAISKDSATRYRQQLQDLDLRKGEDRTEYKKIQRDIMVVNEGCHAKVYDDGRGNPTIGIGCDMAKNKDQWQEAFGKSGPSYDEVLAGRQVLTEGQITQLYSHMVGKREKQLSEKLYAEVWDKLKPNERLAIEDLFYNGGHGLVGAKTQFYKHIHAYAASGKPEDMDKALWEVRFNSNPRNHTGIENRRIAETELLNTFDRTDEEILAAAPEHKKRQTPEKKDDVPPPPEKKKGRVLEAEIPEDVREMARAAVDHEAFAATGKDVTPELPEPRPQTGRRL